MKVTSIGLLLASALTSVGCAHAIARHDLFERGDIRIDRMVETAQRTCREQQPKKALPSAAEYERCVLEELRRGDIVSAVAATKSEDSGEQTKTGATNGTPANR